MVVPVQVPAEACGWGGVGWGKWTVSCGRRGGREGGNRESATGGLRLRYRSPFVGFLVGSFVGVFVGLAVGPGVELLVGVQDAPWYMVSLYLPIATGFVLFHAGRTSTHMGVLRNTASEDGANGREGMQHHSAKTNVGCEAP